MRIVGPRVVFMVVAAVVLGVFVRDVALAIVLLVILYGLSWLPNLFERHRRAK